LKIIDEVAPAQTEFHNVTLRRG